MLRLLSGREYSRAELERKLADAEQAPGELARVLDDLQDKGFIDERRVLESLLHRRGADSGAARIRQELLRKGLSPEAIQPAIRDLQATELTRARALWSRRFGQAADSRTDPRQHARQARYLASRGFGADVIRRVLRETARRPAGDGLEGPDDPAF